MRRILGFVVALVGVLAAGAILWRAPPITQPAAALAVADADPGGQDAGAAPPAAAPKSPLSDAQREARRLARYDKDDDGRVSRGEFLAGRSKDFAKADRNKDGRLDFEEFAVARATKFDRADRDADGQLSPREFAATAVKRKAKPACVCPVAEEE